MNISWSARRTSIKDSFKERAQKRLTKLDRFFGDQANAVVTVTSEKGRETVEVTIQHRGMLYRAERTTDDRLLSLDQVVDTLFRQIVKNKNKLGERLKATAFDDLEPAIEPEADESFVPVKRKKFLAKSMDVEEAILQMNMLGHSFYAFTDAQLGHICIVYRRSDGAYGVLEPMEG